MSTSVTSARAQPQISLEDLEDELGATLVQSFPKTSQMFIHAREPRPGKSWSITQFCKVPVGLQRDLDRDDRKPVFTFEARLSDEKRPALSIKGNSISFRYLRHICGPSTDKSHIPPRNGSFFYFDTNETIRDEFTKAHGKTLPELHQIEPSSWRTSPAIELLDKHTDTGDLRVIWLGYGVYEIFLLAVYRPSQDRPFVRIGVGRIGQTIHSDTQQQWTTNWEGIDADIH